MAASPELIKGGIRAAREARKELAKLVHELGDEQATLGERISQVVGTLFSAEVGGLEKVHGSLDTAKSKLHEVLEGGVVVSGSDTARAISRAQALIHPAVTELGRALSVDDDREDGTEPFLLTAAKGAPPAGEGERRRADRATLELEIGLEGDTRFFTGTSGDLGTGGLFIATETPLVVDTAVVLSFVLPDGYRVSAAGTVAWVRAPRYRPHELPVGMGVRFEDLGPKDRRAIEHFLEAQPAFHYG